MPPFVRYWIPVMAYCAVIFAQSCYPTPHQLPSFALSDKLLHAVAYGILAVLICRAANTTDRWRRRWGALLMVAVVASTLYGISDEWHQSFVPGRDADAFDALADFAGSLICGGIYVALLRRRAETGALKP